MKEFFISNPHVNSVWVNEKGEWFIAKHSYGELVEVTREEALAESTPEESKSKKSTK